MLQPPQKIQSKEKRVRNFREVCQGFSRKNAVSEARRCPQCSDPVCMTACPLKIDIPGFIRLLREGDFPASLQKIKEQNPLPDVCGRVCRAPCEQACVLKKEGDPIAIRTLERFAADHGRSFSVLKRKPRLHGAKVAVVGSGPSGLTVASCLARQKMNVTVFESFPFLGGILRYGIPELRMPQKVLDTLTDDIEMEGVDFKTLTRIGRSLSIEELWSQEYKAVILATGTGGAALNQIPGHDLGGVFFAEEFLMKMNVAETSYSRIQADFHRYKRIAVLGAGHKALDCARLCRRLGKDVTLVFPLSEDDLPIHPQERRLALEEGIEFAARTRPLDLIGDETHFVQGVQCDRLDYADPKADGHWQLMVVPDSAFIFAADAVIIASAHKPDMSLYDVIPGLTSTREGYVWVEELSMKTPAANVFAVGDVTCGQFDIVQTMASAKKIVEYVERGLIRL